MNTGMMHIRLPKEDLEYLDQYADGLLSRQQTATLILRRAIESMRGSLAQERLGPKLKPQPQVLNDAPPPYKPRR
jgi:hypothetical protein